MSRVYISYEKLVQAVQTLNNFDTYIDSLNGGIGIVSNELAELDSKHSCFGVTKQWIEGIQYKINHYSEKTEELIYLSSSLKDLFIEKEGEMIIDANKLPEFNKSVASQELYKLMTGAKEGYLNLSVDELGQTVADDTGTYSIKNAKWSNTYLSELTGREWLDKGKIEKLTAANTAPIVYSTQTSQEDPKTGDNGNSGGGGNYGNSGRGQTTGAGSITTLDTVGALNATPKTNTEITSKTETQEQNTELELKEAKTDDGAVKLNNSETTVEDTDTKVRKIVDTLKAKMEDRTNLLKEKQQAAIDKILENNKSSETNTTDKVDTAKTEIKEAVTNVENKMNDKMEEVKQAVEEKSKPVVNETPKQSSEPKASVAPKHEVATSTPAVTEEPKTETPSDTEPTTDLPSDTEPTIETPRSDDSTDIPAPVHKTDPEEDITITKVPKETTDSSSTSSSSTSTEPNKVIPVVAGVAAAGAAGAGTKIYLDRKSAPTTNFTNEEFVVDDSDYSASNYETAEISSGETNLLKDESSSTYTTRANSETTDSEEEIYKDAIADDLSYDDNLKDTNITFDETTPYEAIDNYEMGETH